jgi:hypothetical protein
MYVRTDDKCPLVSDGQQFHHYEQNEQSPLRYGDELLGE